MSDRAESERDSLDFARFLSVWLFDLKMPEDVFWKTMTPARLCRLFDAHFRTPHRSEPRQSLQKPQKTIQSLSQYLSGMGG